MGQEYAKSNNFLLHTKGSSNIQYWCVRAILQKVVVIYNIDVSELSYKMYKAENKF